MVHRSRYRARGRKIITLLLAACLLAGCGKNGQSNPGGILSAGQSGSGVEEPQGRYKAEPLEVEGGTADWWTPKLAGEYVYYCLYSGDAEAGNRTCSMYRYAFSDGSSEQLPVVISNGSIWFYDVGEGGDIYAVVAYRKPSQGTEGEDGEEESYEATFEFKLEKYDAKGNRVYSTDMEDLPEDNRFFRMASDGGGRVYLYYNGQIACHDGEGNLAGSITSLGGPDSSLTAMGRGWDGAVYACVTRESVASQLIKLDFAKCTAETVTGDFVACAGGGLCAGWEENTLLAQNGGMVYEYDLTDKSRTALLRWTDSGLDGSQVRSFGAAPEGKIFVWETGNTANSGGIFLLRRLSEEEAPQKEEIVLATDVLQRDIGGRNKTPDTLLIESVLAFNNSSDKYHITIKEYGETRDGADTKLNLDLVSGNAPDILYGGGYLISGHEKSLAEQGVFEDLGPWLEQSTVLSREDFVDHTLDGCIYGGKLVLLPQSFYLYTLIGRASDVGEDMGWTMEEMMSLQEKYPETPLFCGIGTGSKNSILDECLKLYMDQFVDWDTGKCSFDSPEFVRLLEFVDRYGDVKEEDSSLYLYGKLNKRKALVARIGPYSLEERQIFDGVFEGESCAVGYPTKDGEPASLIVPYICCGITVSSEHKEGAWAFLESFINYPVNDLIKSNITIPAGKMRFEEYLEKKLAQEEEEILAWDMERGFPLQDEEGNPVILGKGLRTQYFGSKNDSDYVIIRALTQEDVDWFLDILRVARVQPPEQTDIKMILFEEANYFFNGAKSAQEVADIIQNRVQLYLNEK